MNRPTDDDAAGGVGANTALRDAELLGRLIRDRAVSVREANSDVTERYEKEMRTYASQNVKDSFGFAAKQFGIPDELTTVIN